MTPALPPKEIAQLLRRLRHLRFKTHALVSGAFAGNYRAKRHGRGLEFSEVKPYTYGDEAQALDWNVSARMNAPYVKRFQEERERLVMLVVDGSASCAFGSRRSQGGQPSHPPPNTKRELLLELAALIAFSAVKNRDQVGLLIFTDRVELFLPPRKGELQAMRLLRALLFFTPPAAAKKQRSTPKAALTFLARTLKQSGAVFLLSDFWCEMDFRSALLRLKSRHQLYAVQVFDALEKKMPKLGILALQDLETGEPLLVDSSAKSFASHYEAAFLKRKEALQRFFSRLRIQLLSLCLGEPYLRKLQLFLSR